MKKNAFTLAEVLITLGIIGIVAAMTMPTLINNYQKQVYVTTLHKFYTETSQAAHQYITDKNAIDLREAGLVNQDAANYWVNNYMKVVQDCGTNGSDCFATSEYKKMNGAKMSNELIKVGWNYYVLADGIALTLRTRSNGKTLMYIDTNGKKGPNVIGRDTFAVVLYPNGFIDDSNPEVSSNAPLTREQREESFQKYCLAGVDDSIWWGYLGKILNDNWEMNY